MDSLPAGPVAAIVRAMHDEVVQQLALTKEIAHPGESGRAREEIVRRFLRRFVPQGLGIDTGFVIDATGKISRQVDIVIYRDNYHPILEIGGLKHFLVESVVAVIENKASITSRAVLEDALANVRSVKSLDRSAGGRNYIVMDFHGAGTKVQADPHYRVWTGIVADHSVSPELLLEVLQDDMEEHERSVWLDCYVGINGFVSRFIDENDRLVWTADMAHAVGLTDPSAASGEKPLVDLALLLASRLRHAAVVDYSPPLYFPISTAHTMTMHVPGAVHGSIDDPKRADGDG